MNFVRMKLDATGMFDNTIIDKGSLKFPGIQSKNGHFIRFKKEYNMDKIKDHLNNEWKLRKPHLIISITGRRKNFLISNQMKKSFQRGLVESTKNFDSWIITNGSNIGVSKLVGEAISNKVNNTKTKLIGILNWQTVAFRNDLETRNRRIDQKNIIYGLRQMNKTNENECNKDVRLDSNHKYFLLIDDESETSESYALNGTYASEINLRSQLEFKLKTNEIKQEINEYSIYNKKSYDTMSLASNDDESEYKLGQIENNQFNYNIPMISILINGGSDSLFLIKYNLENKIPTLILAGTKGCADLIVKAISMFPIKSLDSLIDESEIFDTKKNLNNYKNLLKEASENLEFIIKNQCKKYLHIFQLDDEMNLNNFEQAILRAFLDSQTKESYSNLKLLLQWNRIDIARSDIFNGEENLNTFQLNEILEMALIENRPLFVELLLQHGLDLNSFLTKNRLYYLYNSITIARDSKRAPLFEIYKLKYNFEIDKIFITFKKLKHFLKNYISEELDFDFLPEDKKFNNYYDELEFKHKLDEAFKYDMISNNCGDNNDQLGEDKSASENLFIWSLFMNRIEIAKLFWQFGRYQMSNALLSSIFYHNLSSTLPDIGTNLNKTAK